MFSRQNTQVQAVNNGNMQNPRTIVLVLLSVAAFADGVAHQLTAPGEMFARSDIIFTFVAALLIFLWHRFDSEQMSYRRTPWLNVAMPPSPWP